MSPSEHPNEPAIADAVADVASAAQRIVEERLALLRIEVRNDAKRILQAGALGVSGLAAVTAAVGMAAAALTLTLALWMPLGPALGITALIAAAVGVGLTIAARKRLPQVSGAAEATGAEERPSLPAARHERDRSRTPLAGAGGDGHGALPAYGSASGRGVVQQRGGA